MYTPYNKKKISSTKQHQNTVPQFHSFYYRFKNNTSKRRSHGIFKLYNSESHLQLRFLVKRLKKKRHCSRVYRRSNCFIGPGA